LRGPFVYRRRFLLAAGSAAFSVVVVPELGVVYDWFAGREPQRAAAELRLLFV
jgi:hypothetical protein